MAQGRFERPTYCLGGSRSIHLSYWVGLPSQGISAPTRHKRHYPKAVPLSTRLTGANAVGMLSGAMKLWFKYLLGILLGALLYFVLPPAALRADGTVAFLAELAARAGQYIFVSLLFASLPVSILRLYEEKKFWKLTGKSTAFFLTSLFIASLFGIAGALVAQPARAPLLADTAAQSIPGLENQLFDIFPRSLSSVFLNSGEYILPAIILAAVIGLAMSHDPVAARPVANFMDSLSRILYTVNTFIAEILVILLIPISARALIDMGPALRTDLYRPILLLLAAESALCLLVAIPASIYLAGGKKNPLPVMYACLAASLAGLASGNLRFSAGTLIKEVRENLGSKRRYNSVTISAGMLLGRIGTALVSASAFVIIISSYSPIGISSMNLLWMALAVPAAVVVNSGSPQKGPILVLTLLCSFFGKGFENGYLVMVPLGGILAMIATFLDTMWIGVSNAMIARADIAAERKSPAHFV